MKRLISLLLIVITLSSLLVGCEWNSEFDWKKIFNWGESEPKWELPEGIIETTVEKDGAQLTIAHSENFTQDDIDFVLTLHGKTRSNAPIEPLLNYDLSDILREGIKGNPIFLSHFENPYFISAYVKSGVIEHELNKLDKYTFDITKYVWYKFYNLEQVVDEIDGMQRTKDTYLLYDCIIEIDIVNKVEYNKKCKCYVEYRGQYVLDKISSDMLIYFDSQLVADVIGEANFIFYPEFGSGGLEIHMNENGVEYFYFDYGIYNKDGTEYKNQAKDLFGEHYDCLVKYFEMLNEYVNDYGKTLKVAGIRLDILIEYLSSNRR